MIASLIECAKVIDKSIGGRHFAQTVHACINVLLKSAVAVFAVLVLDGCVGLEYAVGHG